MHSQQWRSMQHCSTWPQRRKNKYKYKCKQKYKYKRKQKYKYKCKQKYKYKCKYKYKYKCGGRWKREMRWHKSKYGLVRKTQLFSFSQFWAKILRWGLGKSKNKLFYWNKTRRRKTLLFHNAVKICSMAVAKAAGLAMATKGG